MVGLSLDHRLGDVARGVVEAVAWDVMRCLESAAVSGGVRRPRPGGGGATVALWTEILTRCDGLGRPRRRSGEAASAGAALLAAQRPRMTPDLGDLGAGGGHPPTSATWALSSTDVDPVDAQISPDPAAEVAYRRQRAIVDAAADAVIALDFGRAGRAP